MRVTCDQCQKRYLVADEKVRGKSVKIRCKSCQHVFIVVGPPQAAEPQSAELAPEAAVWFIISKGVQQGPLDFLTLTSKARAGELTARTYVWKQGMPDWLRAKDVPEVAPLLSSGVSASPPPAPSESDECERPAASADSVSSSRAASASQREKTDPLGALFSDDNRRELSGVFGESAAPAEVRRAEPAFDPFDALGTMDPNNLPPPGEATRFFIAQAGVNKRNPPWKVAAFLLGGIGLPVAVLFALSELRIVPLEVTRIDKDGREVKEFVFSPGGVAGLGDLLTGRAKRLKEKQAAEAAAKALAARARRDEAAKSEKPVTPEAPSKEALAALYGDEQKRDLGPRVRKDVEEKQLDTTTGGLSAEAVSKVVAQSQPAFQQCIEQELRKNPTFRGGKIDIVATVGSSGIVKKAEIDRREIDASELGSCLKSRAKKMQFATFSGEEEAEVHIPLILSATL